MPSARQSYGHCRSDDRRHRNGKSRRVSCPQSRAGGSSVGLDRCHRRHICRCLRRQPHHDQREEHGAAQEAEKKFHDVPSRYLRQAAVTADGYFSSWPLPRWQWSCLTRNHRTGGNGENDKTLSICARCTDRFRGNLKVLTSMKQFRIDMIGKIEIAGSV